MLLRWRLLLSALTIFTLFATSRVALADGTVGGYVLVKPASGTNISAVAAEYGVTVRDRVPGTTVVALSIPRNSTEADFVSRLSRDRRFTFAETDTFISETEVRGDPVHLAFDHAVTDARFLAQWAAPIGVYETVSPLRQVNLGISQQVAAGRGVIVAVLDTGVDVRHPLLAGRVLPGFNAISPNLPPLDIADGSNNAAVGHGTMVAGIIARIAPSAHILPIRVLNGDGIGTAKDVASGVMYARLAGARVLNISLGSTVRSKTLDEAMDSMEAAGVVCVAAAGNGGARAVQYPSARHEVLVVGAVDGSNLKAPFSNYSGDITVVAPGVGIRSTFTGGGYATWSGTSFAAPFVAAEAAIILSARPSYTPDDVKEIIRASARSVDQQNPSYRGNLGKGIIDIERALRSL